MTKPQLNHIPSTPGEVLKKTRVELKLTQEEVGKLVGTSSQQIWKLEHDHRDWTVKWAKKIAPAIGLNPIELLFPNEFSTVGQEFFELMSSLTGEDRKKAIEILRVVATQSSQPKDIS